MPFSGSYAEGDVTFLLKPVTMRPTEVSEKERLIQSGARHYSEMISAEEPPDDLYVELFRRAVERNGAKLARDMIHLANHLTAHIDGAMVIVSLARAGTPIGVLLKRTLQRMGRKTHHYSISIIRDRGLDTVAMDYILQRHAADAVFFVDGWTGKGAIAAELKRAVATYMSGDSGSFMCGSSNGGRLSDALYVVADLAGVAEFAGSAEDYLIPNAIMNSVVSGLVSRTILNEQYVGPGDFHACLYYDEFESLDMSRWYVDTMMNEINSLLDAESPLPSPDWTPQSRRRLAEVAQQFVQRAMSEFGLTDRNRVKPGVGESTRALLRRVPERLLVSDPRSSELEHLLWLAQRRGVTVQTCDWLPYRAAAIIRTLGH